MATASLNFVLTITNTEDAQQVVELVIVADAAAAAVAVKLTVYGHYLDRILLSVLRPVGCASLGLACTLFPDTKAISNAPKQIRCCMWQRKP